MLDQRKIARPTHRGRKGGKAAGLSATRPCLTRKNKPSESLERYTPERKAEFLLSSAIDATDYADAAREVRAMGIDPDRIPHHKPPGA